MLAVTFWSVFIACTPTWAIADEATVLGIEGARFTLDGKPTFLLGLSYYGGLGAPRDFIRRDLEDARRLGFNWLRVWATWESFGNDVSAVDAHGRPRQPYMDRLVWLVAECERQGIVVDVTLARGQESPMLPAAGQLIDFESHTRAVEAIVAALKPYRNWYLDLANERDVRDDRYVSPEELKSLRQVVRRIDPARLVTASFGGHDLQDDDVRDALQVAELDFICPHRPRGADSPAQTAQHTRHCLALAAEMGRSVPIQYQEPFRRGYTDWQPAAADYLADLQGALEGGAAGWCLHNGIQKDTADKSPRRSFDLTQKRLFDQLDAEELKAAREAVAVVRKLAK